MIIITPTDRWLRQALADNPDSLAVASPYVGAYLSRAVSILPNTVDIVLLTRTVLADFASNASDLEAVTAVAERVGNILSLSSLHAKVYVVDKRALITSANATASGMYRNRECGFEVKGRKVTAELRSFIKAGFGSSHMPVAWTREELRALREPVERLRESLPRRFRERADAVDVPPRLQMPKRNYSRLVESFAGWLRLTIVGISAIPADVFTMADVVAVCAPLAAVEFPNNRHIREKLRQQMQRLRDLGLVAFLGKGRYELLARSA